MNGATSNEICEAVAAILSCLQDALLSLDLPALTVSEFSSLEGEIGRLMEKASANPQELFKTLRCDYSELVSDTVEILQRADKLQLTRNGAIQESCLAIKDHLWRLEYLKQRQAPTDSAWA